jgi:uncharacterized protein
LVTGASAGIGEAIARRLAADGVDVILVARRGDRLEALAEELRSPVTRIDVMARDLCDPGDLAEVEERLRSTDRPVDLLVNNAGRGAFGPFWGVPVEREAELIDLNVTALVRLTHAVLGRMVSDGRGAVMNLSSVAGFQPGPGNAVYAATKSFVTAFSESLAVELGGTGVTVTAVAPGLTRSEFSAAAGLGTSVHRVPRVLWMSADSVARECIEATEQGKVIHVTGLANRVLAVVSDRSPRRVRRRVAGLVLGRLRPTRPASGAG